MIHYHGTPITPTEAALRVLRGRHAFVSVCAKQSLSVVLDVCQSFALDNGAFSVWRRGQAPDWAAYYEWVADLSRYPHFDFAVIPDVIDGDEAANDALMAEWPHGTKGAPVWHLHESIGRLRRLCAEWPRVCLGSSGDFATPNTRNWRLRMQQAMEAITVDDFPVTKLHGLRMLNPDIFGAYPLASADSTNVAQNMGVPWRSQYEPATKATKAIVIAERVELAPAARTWRQATQATFALESVASIGEPK